MGSSSSSSSSSVIEVRISLRTAILSFLLILSLPALRWLASVLLRHHALSPKHAFGHELLSTLFANLKIVEKQKFRASLPKRIILIRHGESEGNLDSLVYNKTPDRLISLSPKGKQQALEAGRKLRELVKNESLLFFVSPFARCRQTFENISKAFGDERQYEVREDPRIREQEWGNLQSDTSKESLALERKIVGRFFFRFPQGESGADVFDRVTTFLESLFRRFDRGGVQENVVVVTHGLLMRLFLMRFFYWSVEKFERIENFGNCEMVVLDRLDPENKHTYTLSTALRYSGDEGSAKNHPKAQAQAQPEDRAQVQ